MPDNGSPVPYRSELESHVLNPESLHQIASIAIRTLTLRSALGAELQARLGGLRNLRGGLQVAQSAHP